MTLAYLVRKLSGSIDLIVVESALLLMPILAVTHHPIIWDANGCQTVHYRSRRRRSLTLMNRLHMRLAGSVWHEIERWAGRRCVALVAESQAESARWQEVFPKLGPKIHVVELVPEVGEGHDPLSDGLVAKTPRPSVDLSAVPTTGYVAFVGSNSKHNVDAARWCIQTLAPRLPSTVAIVLAGLETDKLVAAAGSPHGVVGLGYVEDIDHVLSRAEICIAPIATGEGPETKVLHYVALGCRVAATPLALEGLEGAPGCCLADLDELTDVVVGMLAEGETALHREERQAAQKEWLEKYAAPHRIQEQWMAVLAGVRRSRRGTSP
ncbi:MAG: glycosyltransferase [Candidatus Dormibacteria bacterium]